MLGKLMKYEWKSTAKIVSIILIVVAGATLLGILGIVFPVRYLAAKSSNMSGSDSIAIVFMSMTAMMTFFLYVFSMVGVSYALYGYLGVRFYKTMYTDEGYLTHTLPLNPGQILKGKTIVAMAWVLILGACVALSATILIGSAVMLFGNVLPDIGIPDVAELMRELNEAKQEIIEQGYALQAVHFLVSMILTVIVTPFGVLMMLFGGLSIGQLARKHKLLLGILVTVGIFFINSILGQLLRFIFTFAAMAARDPAAAAAMSYNGALDAGVLSSLIMGCVLYFVTYQIVSKKLNLD